MVLSEAALELDKLLCEDNGASRAIRKRFTRMTLWKWRTGNRTPYASHASELETLSKKRVRANKWGVSP